MRPHPTTTAMPPMWKLSIPFFLASLLLVPACSLTGGEDPPPEPEPLFAPGDYGGDPLPGTEELYNVRLSPDGSQVALIRSFTPGQPGQPRDQLWITDRDGSDPRLIGVNVGTVDWSPDGERLAVTVSYGIDVYVYTIDLATLEAVQWTGGEAQFFSKPTVSNPVWFEDGRRLLVSVSQKAYEQPFERGIYTIDTRTGAVEGPLVELMQGAFLGGGDRYAVGVKFIPGQDPLDGNLARYDFERERWSWVTRIPRDSLDFIGTATPSPTADQVAQSRYAGNAWQLFLMEGDGTAARQMTTLGGDNPRWSYDGGRVLFRRDVHRGPGARYVPFAYDVAAGTAAALWPDLPDSLPAFPPLSTQALSRAAELKQ